MNETILGFLMLVMIALQAVVINRVRNRQVEALKENYTVLFGNDTNNHGVHGYLMVDSKARGIVQQIIPFAFEGVSTTPELSISLFKLIVEQAEMDGYRVYHLQAYRGVKSLSETMNSRRSLNERSESTR